jgi:hypothetical protein
MAKKQWEFSWIRAVNNAGVTQCFLFRPPGVLYKEDTTKLQTRLLVREDALGRIIK